MRPTSDGPTAPPLAGLAAAPLAQLEAAPTAPITATETSATPRPPRSPTSLTRRSSLQNRGAAACVEKNPLPFQRSKKTPHHRRSALASALSRTHCESFRWSFDASINQRTNERPAGTTVAACCNDPINDSRSRFFLADRDCYALTSWRRRSSFACSSRIRPATVSNSMPKKTSVELGPPILSLATGTPSCSQTCSPARNC